jgi:hypothetical protein
MTFLGIPIRELIVGIVAILTALFVTWNKVRDLKIEKEQELLPNPERCGIHQTKIAVIEQRLENIEQDIEEIKRRLP